MKRYLLYMNDPEWGHDVQIFESDVLERLESHMENKFYPEAKYSVFTYDVPDPITVLREEIQERLDKIKKLEAKNAKTQPPTG